MANLGSFVELYEVQVAVVAMIYLDLVASTAQLLPYLAGDEAGGGAGGGEGGAVGSTEAGFGAFVVRLVSRLMQVTLGGPSTSAVSSKLVATADRRKRRTRNAF